MKNVLIFIWEIAKIVIIALLIVVPIRYFIFQPFFVKGPSMEFNFSNGDYLIVDQVTYRFKMPQRGEVIVFKYPNDPSQRFIKRIIGLPGETIEIKEGKVIIYNYREGAVAEEAAARVLEESDYLSLSVFTSGDIRLTLDKNEYFVLGDNRAVSTDSRRFGPLPKENIIGRVLIRLWPFVAFAKIEAPNY